MNIISMIPLITLSYVLLAYSCAYSLRLFTVVPRSMVVLNRSCTYSLAPIDDC